MDRLSEAAAAVRRHARLVVPIVVIVVAGVAVLLAQGGGEDASRPAATPAPPAGAGVDPEPQAQPSPEATNRLIARVQRAALARATDIAAPIITRAQAAGRITAADAAALRRAARALARGRTPQQLAGTVDVNDPGVRAVVRRSLAALTRRARKIAKPLLDRALRRGDITSAEAADIRAFVASGGGYALP